MARFCKLPRAEQINNTWGRKTFVTTGLARMHLPAQRIMEVSLHRSEQQMRDNYCGKAGTDESRAKTTRLMANYASGIKAICV